MSQTTDANVGYKAVASVKNGKCDAIMKLLFHGKTTNGECHITGDEPIDYSRAGEVTPVHIKDMEGNFLKVAYSCAYRSGKILEYEVGTKIREPDFYKRKEHKNGAGIYFFGNEEVPRGFIH
jgi:hypothetical protein